MKSRINFLGFALLFTLAAILLIPSISFGQAAGAYARIEIDGNAINGETTIPGLEDTITLLNVGFNVTVPTDAGSGQTTGARQYRPLKIQKYFDKTSPLLFKALTLNENVNSAEIVFYRPNNQNGQYEHYFTILLENAQITSIVSNQVEVRGEMHLVELISFVFQRITMRDEINGTEHTDDFRAPI